MEEEFKEKSEGKIIRGLVSILKIIVVALVINILVKAFILRPYTVVSGSMEPTLMVGDKVFAEVFTSFFSKPQKSDIIVFVFPGKNGLNGEQQIRRTPLEHLNYVLTSFSQFQWPANDEEEYVKRVIGVPGDIIDIDEGQVFVNGAKLIETYLEKGITTENTGGMNFPYTVKEGEYFVLGDNRGNSADSRYWGTVPEENIIGKPFVTFFPLNRFHFLGE